MKVNWDHYPQDMEKKENVPNHQPAWNGPWRRVTYSMTFVGNRNPDGGAQMCYKKSFPDLEVMAATNETCRLYTSMKMLANAGGKDMIDVAMDHTGTLAQMNIRTNSRKLRKYMDKRQRC